MGTVLVTGATGYIGSLLTPRLATSHDVVALSRGAMTAGYPTVRGNFTSSEDVRALDSYTIDTVVHLASEIGGCSEEAGMSVNVLGTRTLLRYLVDRGCRHFVLASSIAATGCLSPQFMPRELPISDDHPCDAVDAYGLSKALMEELAYYFHRQYPGIEITLFRIGAAWREDFPLDDQTGALSTSSAPFVVGGGFIATTDILDALTVAVAHRLGPGVRRLNLVAATARTTIPVPEALKLSLGGERFERLDTSYYNTPGREMASLYCIQRLWRTYGFRPSIDLRTMTTTPAVAARVSEERQTDAHA